MRPDRRKRRGRTVAQLLWLQGFNYFQKRYKKHSGAPKCHAQPIFTGVKSPFPVHSSQKGGLAACWSNLLHVVGDSRVMGGSGAEFEIFSAFVGVQAVVLVNYLINYVYLLNFS